MFRSSIPIRRIQASMVIILLLIFLSISQPITSGAVLNFMQLCGGIFIIIAALIRTLSSIYIAGYKNHRLITEGPYSLSRNPLYLCWLCGALGVGLVIGSALGALLLGTVIFFIYHKAIRIEEERLMKRFPQKFNSYIQSTPRWLGLCHKINFHLDHPPNPRLIIQALLEGVCLLLIYPLHLFISNAQHNGILPILLRYY